MSSEVFIAGIGAVSPAGWNVAALREALSNNQPFASQELSLSGNDRAFSVLRVPPPNPRPSFLTHPRLRRTSPITQFTVSAALEALGARNAASEKSSRLGVILCVLSGCVNYTRRFYDEAIKDPATASPLVFPETVFNAPGSHLSAFLGTPAINYTLVGDCGTFITGIATGANWLLQGKVDECVVVGAEEVDWLTADALRLFDRGKVLSEGAGAVLLNRISGVRLNAITDEHLYCTAGKTEALRSMKGELHSNPAGKLLVDGISADTRISFDEAQLWSDWSGQRISPKRTLGEALMAGAAWQVVAAADAIMNRKVTEAVVSIAGFHQHAIGAHLSASWKPSHKYEAGSF